MLVSGSRAACTHGSAGRITAPCPLPHGRRSAGKRTHLLGQQRRGADLVVLLVVLLDVHLHARGGRRGAEAVAAGRDCQRACSAGRGARGGALHDGRGRPVAAPRCRVASTHLDGERVEDVRHILDVVELNVHDGTDHLRARARREGRAAVVSGGGEASGAASGCHARAAAAATCITARRRRRLRRPGGRRGTGPSRTSSRGGSVQPAPQSPPRRALPPPLRTYLRDAARLLHRRRRALVTCSISWWRGKGARARVSRGSILRRRRGARPKAAPSPGLPAVRAIGRPWATHGGRGPPREPAAWQTF